MAIASCAGKRPTNLGVTDGKLAPCPATPNCVSSDATDRDHVVAPFEVAVSASLEWRAVVSAVTRLPRTTVVRQTSNYLHVEVRSRVFRFVDDLELHWRPEQGVIAVRSASRVGSSDLGVNRRRVERLRAVLRESGIVR